jgi:hypothetical protein
LDAGAVKSAIIALPVWRRELQTSAVAGRSHSHHPSLASLVGTGIR